MRRKEKVDNALLKRFAREETERRQDVRPKRRFYLIVCEGTKTEPYYFEGLKRNLPPGVVNTVSLEIDGTGRNTLNLIDYALKARKRFEQIDRTIDEVWAVFDRDSFPDVHFNNAIFKAQSVGIECAWTNESFELWYLLHFQYFQNGMSRTTYADLLERELSAKLGRTYTYDKSSPDLFALLKQHGDVGQAIERAKRLEAEFSGRTDYADHNPCTRVYVLVEKLLFPGLPSPSKPD